MTRVVLSLGGNAFAQGDGELTMASQFEFAERALTPLQALTGSGAELLVSHGNGPQVGYMLIRVQRALGDAYALPLEVCVAESEGELGYVLQQTLYNLTNGKRPVSTLLTQVEVNPDDPAFARPTKPIGPYLDMASATLLESRGMTVGKYGERFRRLVPSPAPYAIVEIDTIQSLLAMGVIVIAGGGGGIPVVRRDGQLEGVEAVVDKDTVSAMLAERVSADILMLITNVPAAYINFGTPDEKAIGRVNAAKMQELIHEGHFGEGTMLPKVQAAVAFATATGRPAVICNAEDIPRAQRLEMGTIIEGNRGT